MAGDRILFRMTFAMASAALGLTIAKIALPTLAGIWGHSAAQIGLIAGAAAFAWPAFGLVVGWSLDQFGRAPAFRLGAGMAAATATSLLVLFYAEQQTFALLCLLAVFIGISEVLTETAGQTILPDLVDESRLEKGNSWLQGAKTVSAMLLAPLLLTTVFDFRPVWTFGCVLALMIVALLAIPGPERPPQRPTLGRVRLFAGLERLARDAPHRRFTVMLTLMTVSWGAWMTLIVPYSLSEDHLDLGARGVGHIMAALGGGSVLGAVGFGTIKRHLSARGTLFVDPLASAVFLLVPGLGLGLVPVLASAALAGVGGVTWAIFVSAHQQAAIPAGVLGRSVAAYRWIGWTGFFVGATCSGGAADVLGLRTAFILFALPSVLGIALCAWRDPVASPPRPQR